MSESRRSTIGEHTYELELFGSKQGQRILRVLFCALGSGLAQIFIKGGAEGIGPAIAAAATSLTDRDLEMLTDTFASKTKVLLIATTQGGKKEIPTSLADIYDGHFAQRYDEWILWLGWAVKENYQSFFSGKAAKDIAAKLDDLGLLKSESPKG